jgi:predicted dehydrogenase
VFADPGIDAVVIATPVESHFELVLAALRADKHVLVERPMARTSQGALRLIEESERRRLVLIVDHTYVFSPAIDAITQALRTQELRRLLYWDSARLNLGLVRSDVNVAWDVASHDLSILDHVLPTPPCALMATGVAPRRGGPEHLAHITLHFPDGLLAHIHASWISPFKVRRTLIGGSRRMLVYDDLETINKVVIHDCAIDCNSGEAEVHYRRSDVRAVGIGTEEPLHRAVEHFAECIAGARRPIADGEAGLRVVRLLEAVDSSLEAGRRIVSLGCGGVVA